MGGGVSGLTGKRPPWGPEETGHGERDEQGEITGQGRQRCRAQKEEKERTKGEESFRLSEGPVRKIILQMHTPVGTSQCWSQQPRHGLGMCIWMHLVNGTGNSPSLGQPTLD